MEEAAAKVPAGAAGVIAILSNVMNAKRWVHASPSFLQFDLAERAVAPGQLVALYDIQTNEVLGSARIRATDGRWCNVDGNSR